MIFDIVIGAFFVIYLIVGLSKGFGKMLLSLIGTVVTLVIAILLAAPFANFLQGVLPIDKWLVAPMYNHFAGIDALNVVVPATQEGMQGLLTSAGVPGFIAIMLAPILFKAVPTSLTGVTGAQYLASSLSWIILVIASAIILFILIRIVIWMLQILFKKLAFRGGAARAVSHILGGVLGVAKAYFSTLVIMMILSLLLPFSFMAPVSKNLEESTIGKWIYENNFLQNWLINTLGAETNEGKEQNPENQNPENTTDGEQTQTASVYDRCGEIVSSEGQAYRLILTA